MARLPRLLILLTALVATTAACNRPTEDLQPVAASGGAKTTQDPLPKPAPKPAPTGAPVWGYRVVQSYPHDRFAFTQGLLYHGGKLYESTGHYGRSTLREVELETGRVLRQQRLSPSYFGEGLVMRDGQLIQLTWQEGTAFVWDLRDFSRLFEHRYKGEGWGLADDGTRLILSDGTRTLRFLHPDSFVELGRVNVHEGGRPVTNLNELEWIDGELYANVWLSNRIAVIDVATGEVRRWIDLKGLIDLPPDPPVGDPQNVLNGIAWDAEQKRLFVTGKNWPKLFHVELVPPAGG